MEFMVTCFDALDTYGKTKEQLNSSIKLFVVMLAKYPAALISKAFEQWVATERKMPAPADIIEIIETDNAKLLDFVGYVRDGGNITPEAERYVSGKLGSNWRAVYV